MPTRVLTALPDSSCRYGRCQRVRRPPPGRCLALPSDTARGCRTQSLHVPPECDAHQGRSGVEPSGPPVSKQSLRGMTLGKLTKFRDGECRYSDSVRHSAVVDHDQRISSHTTVALPARGLSRAGRRVSAVCGMDTVCLQAPSISKQMRLRFRSPREKGVVRAGHTGPWGRRRRVNLHSSEAVAPFGAGRDLMRWWQAVSEKNGTGCRESRENQNITDT